MIDNILANKTYIYSLLNNSFGVTWSRAGYFFFVRACLNLSGAALFLDDSSSSCVIKTIEALGIVSFNLYKHTDGSLWRIVWSIFYYFS